MAYHGRLGVESYAWLRYMEFPYLGQGLLVKWGRPPSLHNIIDPAVVREIRLEGPGGSAGGALVVSDEAHSLHGVALPLPVRRMGRGLYRVGLAIENGVYTRARVKGYGGFVEVCVYGGRREAEAMGFTPLESSLIRGYATTHLVLGYGEKTIIGSEPLGFDLEIVPVEIGNMYEPGEVIEVQVLRRGEPLGGAKVEATYIDGSRSETTSNEDGYAVVKLGPAVTVISVTHVEPAGGDSDYDKVKTTATLSVQALTI